MQRNLLIFENSFKSRASRKTYLYYIDKFISDFDLKYYDDLASVPQDKLQIMVEYFVMDFKKKISPNIIEISVSALKVFLDCNDVELRWEKYQEEKIDSFTFQKFLEENVKNFNNLIQQPHKTNT